MRTTRIMLRLALSPPVSGFDGFDGVLNAFSNPLPGAPVVEGKRLIARPLRQQKKSALVHRKLSISIRLSSVSLHMVNRKLLRSGETERPGPGQPSNALATSRLLRLANW